MATRAAHKFYCVARPLDGSTGGMAAAESAKAFVDYEDTIRGIVEVVYAQCVAGDEDAEVFRASRAGSDGTPH